MAGADLSDPVPSVIASHVDVVYRVFGTRSRAGGRQGGLFTAFRGGQKAPRRVHAVKDVSFTAMHGEAIGIIGRNGSGKSTLLRAVAGLMPPTSGEVWAAGTPALLGVNAILVRGLSGARNIYIGAQALGLSRAEVDEAFDEIVDFAEIGDAIHLPMSTYSSGMAARLRFAISTAASPEVLVIDEALATGDAHFREKSSERITELRKRAGTIFLVSHSANTIREMTDRALWLHDGVLVADGASDDVVDEYAKNRRVQPTFIAPYEKAVPGVARWQSGSRPELSARVSSRLVEDRVSTVVLAPAADATAGLLAVPVAASRAGLVLQVPHLGAPEDVVDEVRRLRPAEVHVLGNTRHVSDDAVVALGDALGMPIDRIDGETKGDVAAACTRLLPPDDVDRVYLVLRGDEQAAFVAAQAAAWGRGAVLLTNVDAVPDATLAEVARLRPQEVVVVGDENVLSDDVLGALGDRYGVPVRRVVGDTATLVAGEVAERHPQTADLVLVGSTTELGEAVTALSGAVLVDAPVLLVDPAQIPDAAHRELERLAPERIVVLGSAGSIDPAVRRALAAYVARAEDDDEDTAADLF